MGGVVRKKKKKTNGQMSITNVQTYLSPLHITMGKNKLQDSMPTATFIPAMK